jgi:hypothetical protein
MLHLQTALAFPPMRPSAAAGLTARHAPKSLAPPNMGEAEPARLSEGVEPQMAKVHIADMADSGEQPIMEPFQDKVGTGWHVVIRYYQGHERRIDGFGSKDDAVDWITANSGQLDKQP